YIYNRILLASMAAIGLQFLLGTAGLVSVGNSAFLLIGSFGAVICLNSGINFPFDLFFVLIVSGFVGLIAGLPSLRIRALFLALSTLAVFYISVFFGNLYQSRDPDAAAAGFVIQKVFQSYGFTNGGHYWAWLLTGFAGFVILIINRLMHEKSGRAYRMIRDHEFVAESLGIPVFRYKLFAFVISSMIVGTVGDLMAHFSGMVSTENFSVAIAFEFIAMIVIGGLDSVVGAIIGAVVVVGLPTIVPNLIGPLIGTSNAAVNGPNISVILYGTLVIVFVTSSPDGVVGLLRVFRRKLYALVLRSKQ
ncbi:MAG: branched-chain amino acid ABC transporter permease, partial [Bacteroidota bacterium]